MDAVLLAGLLVSLLLLFGASFLIYQLILQNGRILTRLESLEHWAAGWSGELEPYDEVDVEDYTGMLPLGVSAPPFTLPDLSQTPRSLSEWRGRRLLLVFFDPESSFCLKLLPFLAAFERDVVPDRPLPVVLTTGDLTRNRALFDASGFAGPVLLQVEMEVASAYKVDGTPMSYLIEADGSIASELAVGIQATLILAGEMESVADATSTANAPGLSDRRPVRNGLTPGESAPVFRLPRLDGGELSLLEYRGRQVIVVFSDVECEPCDRLAPQLVDAHRAQPDLPIVIVGRGDAEKNRAKVEEFGLPFPVVLQRHWEVSQEYGLLAAPIAYLVDEWGVIASGVAVGPDAVMELITFVSESSDKKPISL